MYGKNRKYKKGVKYLSIWYEEVKFSIIRKKYSRGTL